MIAAITVRRDQEWSRMPRPPFGNVSESGVRGCGIAVACPRRGDQTMHYKQFAVGSMFIVAAFVMTACTSAPESPAEENKSVDPEISSLIERSADGTITPKCVGC